MEEFLEKNVSEIKANGFEFLFPEINFSKPTRKNPVSLVFTSKIQYNKTEIEITSKPSGNILLKLRIEVKPAPCAPGPENASNTR